MILEALEAIKDQLQAQRDSVQEQERLEFEGHRASLSLPATGALDRIVRYEIIMARWCELRMCWF